MKRKSRAGEGKSGIKVCVCVGRGEAFFIFKRLGLLQQRFSGDAAFSTSELRGEKPSAQRNKGWMGFKKGKACARLHVQELWDGKFRPRAENRISGRVKGCSRLGSLIFGSPGGGMR